MLFRDESRVMAAALGRAKEEQVVNAHDNHNHDHRHAPAQSFVLDASASVSRDALELFFAELFYFILFVQIKKKPRSGRNRSVLMMPKKYFGVLIFDVLRRLPLTKILK